jgi:sugar/nucleoside kinase (ribokinase family)
MTRASKVNVACVGDLMLECIVHDASWPAGNSTLVVDSQGKELGGAAYNTCWNLAHLGRTPRLVAAFGRRDTFLVRETLTAADLPDGGLIETAEDTDLLVVLVQGGVSRSVYLRSRLPKPLGTEVRARIGQPKCLILVGSRHPGLRRTALDLVGDFRGELLVFSPGYAIYEYAVDELEPLIRRANVTVMNREESEHMCRILGVVTPEYLARSLPGIVIVTMAHKGAHVFESGRVLELASYSRSTVDTLGAGDAFLAGFLVEKLRGADTWHAGRFASMCGAYVVEAARVRVALAEDTIRRWLLERA